MKINLAHIDTGWKSRLATPIKSSGLTLLPLQTGHFESVPSFSNDPELYRFVPDISNGNEALDWLQSVFSKRRYQFHLICLAPDSLPVGIFMHTLSENSLLFIGGWIGTAFQNKGVARKLLTVIPSFHQTHKLKRDLHADIHPENLSARRVLEQAGFRQIPFPESDRILFRYSTDTVNT